DSEGSETSGKLREAVSHHLSISMEMDKGKGAGVRCDVGAGKTCLLAIDPEDIRRHLTSRGEVASAQCGMVKNRSRHVSNLIRDIYNLRLLFSIGGEVRDDHSRVTDRISCERGCVPPGHCSAQSLSR